MSRSLLLFSLLALTACGSFSEEIEVPLGGQPTDMPALAPAADFWKITGHRLDDSTWEWIFSTSVRVLRDPVSGARIRLFALTHVAPLSYYRSMEDQLRPSDLVLFEGLIGDEEPGRNSELGWVMRYQASQRRFMGYSSQSEWESNLRNRRWINVDCSAKAASAGIDRAHIEVVTAEDKESVVAMERFNEQGGTSEEASRIRSVIGADTLSGALSGDAAPGTGGRKLQDPRNFAIFTWVKQRLAAGRERDFALLYGALHAQALEPYFVRDLGFRLESATWHEVYRYRIDVHTCDQAVLRGRLRMREGDDEGAIADLNRALHLDPTSVDAHFYLFQLYLKQERYEPALLEIEKVLAVRPDYLAAMSCRAFPLEALCGRPSHLRPADRAGAFGTEL
jgi:hypothetical protein